MSGASSPHPEGRSTPTTGRIVGHQPHTSKAAARILDAKIEIRRALKFFPEEFFTPNNPNPSCRRLQQVAGALQLLFTIVEPLIKEELAEPAPISGPDVVLL